MWSQEAVKLSNIPIRKSTHICTMPVINTVTTIPGIKNNGSTAAPVNLRGTVEQIENTFVGYTQMYNRLKRFLLWMCLGDFVVRLHTNGSASETSLSRDFDVPPTDNTRQVRLFRIVETQD